MKFNFKKSTFLVGAIALALLLAGVGINRIREIRARDRATAKATEARSVAQSDLQLRGKTQERKEKPAELLYGPKYQTFSDDGEINEELLLLAGINPDRRPEVQAILSESWEQLSTDLQSRVQYSEDKSDSSAGLKVYTVKASPEKAKIAIEDLRSKLQRNFGTGAANFLIPYLTKPSYFAGFGAYDMEVQSALYKTGSGLTTFKTITFKVLDPVSGKLLAKNGFRTKKGYQIYLGNLLDKEILEGNWNDVRQ